MSFHRTLLLICAVLFGAACTARAGSGGSTYSMLGLGDIRYMSGARSAGMGYTGIALPTSMFINPTAPATWARITRTRVDATLLYEGFNTSDGFESRYLSEFDFAGGLMAIPISQVEGIVLVGGFTPYSNVSFDLATTGTYRSGSEQINYSLRHVGTGGLGQAQIGLSYSPRDLLAVGASLNYVFGTIEKTTQMTARPDIYGTGIRKEMNYIRGVVANVGALYSGFGGVLRPLNIGFNVTTPGVFSSTIQKSFIYTGGSGNNSTDYDTLSEANANISVPIALGFGLTWAASDRLVFAADYRMQPWGSSEFYGEKPAGLRNSQMAGIGFEMGPTRDPAGSFWNNIAYRLGFYYNATYYQVKGIPINEWSGTVGLSVPISGDTRLNLSGEYGVRGKTASALVKETVFRFTASITLGEMWFVRPEEE